MTPVPNQPTPNGDWTHNQKYVLRELERLNDTILDLKSELNDKLDNFMEQNHQDHEAVKEHISRHDTDIALLNLKASIWGAFGGFLAVVTSVILSKFIGI